MAQPGSNDAHEPSSFFDVQHSLLQDMGLLGGGGGGELGLGGRRGGGGGHGGGGRTGGGAGGVLGIARS